MQSAWNDTVLVEAFDAAMAKYQMREVLSKRKSGDHESREEEEVGDKQEGVSAIGFQNCKEVQTVEQTEATMFVSQGNLDAHHEFQKGVEGQTYYFGSKHERLPSAKEVSLDPWQQQQLQDLEDQQEELFKQLYHIATSMFMSGASVHQLWG